MSGTREGRASVRNVFGATILAVLACAMPIRAALAQGTTVNAGSLAVDAGTTATVPISIVLPSGQTAATLQFNLTVVPGSGAPVLSEQITFTNSTSNPTSQNAANGLSTRLIGWFSNFDPLLTGTVALGTLSVPIPAGSEGKTYTVQVIAPSGTADADNTIDIEPISGVNGTITVNGGGPVGTTVNAADVAGNAGTTADVPISIVLPSGQTCATLQFNLTVVPGGGAPVLTEQVTFTNATSNPTSQNAANGLSTRLIGWFSNFDPLLTGTVALGTLSVPIPAGANGTYTVQVIAPSGTADADNTIDIDPISGVNGTIQVGIVGPTATSTPTATQTTVVNTATQTPTATRTSTSGPTNTASATPTRTNTTGPTATRTHTPGGAPTPAPFDDDGGCQINSTGSASAGWLLLIPAIGLLVMRRKQR